MKTLKEYLENWASWASSAYDRGAQGYPKASPIWRLMKYGIGAGGLGVFQHYIDSNREAEFINDCLVAMHDVNPSWVRAIEQRWFYGRTHEAGAYEMGVSKALFSSKLAAAEDHLEICINRRDDA